MEENYNTNEFHGNSFPGAMPPNQNMGNGIGTAEQMNGSYPNNFANQSNPAGQMGAPYQGAPMNQMNPAGPTPGGFGSSGENIKIGKKTYNRVLLMYVIFFFVSNGMQLLFQLTLTDKFGDTQWFQWALIAIPIYAIGFPILYFSLKGVPVMVPEKHSMKFSQFLLTVLIGAGICGVGSVIGMIVSMPILLPFGKSVTDANALMELMTDSNDFLRILVVGILAPIFEELIFRKLLVDHVVKFGEWPAIFLSGLMFGLFHGNFQQFFFATGLGMLFAFIYVRTGKVWYTILFHMVINLTSSVITMKVLQVIDLEGITEMSNEMSKNPNAFDPAKYGDILPGFILYMGWMGFLGCCCLAGIIILIVSFVQKKFYLRGIVGELPKKGRMKAATGNAGFILFTLCCVSLFVIYYVSVIMAP